ncbi:transcriptional regulator, TetR family [Nocardia nova SH22a]|uniref:Transcriptional regulator, TetR family n=1 Tax=Nocardia nova SH22a TaxID=1415166 RepID=W5TCI1_9NOCA|nr:TetR/AcrR family transcriptional regulator [Nocardia nova]AHH17055.1 transcriptional regulator, TetR family [Nocardia nova SH22a]
MSDKTASRTYRSALRSEQAAATRRRVLEAAAACFVERGYGGTSLADIGSRAGVSTETVKSNGPKRNLLLGAFEQAFAGVEGQAPVSDSDAAVEVAAIADDDRFLTAAAAFVAAANARTSALWTEFLSAANADAAVSEALDGLLARRKQDYRTVVGMLIEREIACGDTDPETAADELSFLWSPESHQQLVLQGGWSMDRYRAWLVATVRRQLG